MRTIDAYMSGIIVRWVEMYSETFQKRPPLMGLSIYNDNFYLPTAACKAIGCVTVSTQNGVASKTFK